MKCSQCGDDVKFSHRPNDCVTALKDSRAGLQAERDQLRADLEEAIQERQKCLTETYKLQAEVERLKGWQAGHRCDKHMGVPQETAACCICTNLQLRTAKKDALEDAANFIATRSEVGQPLIQARLAELLREYAKGVTL